MSKIQKSLHIIRVGIVTGEFDEFTPDSSCLGATISEA